MLNNMAKGLRHFYLYKQLFFVFVIAISNIIRSASSNNIKRYVVSSPGITKLNSDLGYLLTKLSDDEIIQVLKDQDDLERNKEHSVNDGLLYKLEESNSKQFNLKSGKNQATRQKAFFKLDHKELDPYSTTSKHSTNEYQSHRDELERHLKNILYNHPKDYINHENYNKDSNYIFKKLSSQIKALCCENGDQSIRKKPRDDLSGEHLKQRITDPYDVNDYVKEHLFLILNDELKNQEQDDLVAVDPDSLSNDSKILILGPITKALPDVKLLKLMKRIENELSKIQYVPFLEYVAKSYQNNQRHGPITTRRYIKPHRCNHQSKLARVYGGPKWLICTGYININGPSLYD